jgi:hypothetical protein
MSFPDAENMSLSATELPEPTAQSRSCSSAPTSSDEISLLDNEPGHVASSPQNKVKQPEYVIERRNLGTTYVVLGCYLTGDASLCTAALRL